MGFIFRSIFWLALAIVVVPPESRLGGHDTADFRNVDFELEIHNAAFAAWSYTSNLSQGCETNPKLCQAAAGLWNTTWKTIGNLAEYAPVESELETGEIRTADAKTAHHRH